MNTIYIDTYYFSWKNMVFMTWSNWNWSKEYTPFGPTDNHLDQSKVQWSKWFGPRKTLTCYFSMIIFSTVELTSFATCSL